MNGVTSIPTATHRIDQEPPWRRSNERVSTHQFVKLPLPRKSIQKQLNCIQTGAFSVLRNKRLRLREDPETLRGRASLT